MRHFVSLDLSDISSRRNRSARSVFSVINTVFHAARGLPNAKSGHSPVSFDYRVDPQQEWFRDCDAERFGRGQIDNKIELGGLFN